MAVPRVLVVGGGFGGMYCARRLERRLPAGAAEIVLINPENYMLYTPLLPEAASGMVEPRHVTVPLRRVLRRTQLLVGEATEVDLDRRTVTYQPAEGEPQTVSWDRLVLAPGSVTRTFPIPGLTEHARGFKSLAEGVYLRNHVVEQLELADASGDPEERRARLTFVVVGAGYAGTELVAELEALVRHSLRAYRTLRREDLRWLLVDVAPRVLPELGGRLSQVALDVLRRRGIEIRLKTTVEEAGPDWVRLSDGETVRTRTFVWTAGVTPDPLIAKLDLPKNEQGRLVTDEYLVVRGRDDVFAVGDAAAVPLRGRQDAIAPPTAQHALRQAKACADNVAASLGHGSRRPFTFKGIGLAVNLADHRGVVRVMGVPLSGPLGWWVTRTYHLLSLPTWGRRLRVALDWTVAMLFPRDIADLGSLGHPEPLPGDHAGRRG